MASFIVPFIKVRHFYTVLVTFMLSFSPFLVMSLKKILQLDILENGEFQHQIWVRSLITNGQKSQKNCLGNTIEFHLFCSRNNNSGRKTLM